MRPQIALNQYAHGRLIGARATASPLRAQMEPVLLRGEEMILDFGGIQVTQSFIDELIGVLILRHGPDILNQIIFRACTPDVRAIIEFVAADRCDQYIKQHTH